MTDLGMTTCDGVVADSFGESGGRAGVTSGRLDEVDRGELDWAELAVEGRFLVAETILHSVGGGVGVEGLRGWGWGAS